MAASTVNFNLATGQKAERKLEIVYVNVGSSSSPEWEILGRGVEDAATEFNHDTNARTDITGVTDVDVSAAKPQLSLDPNSIRGGLKLNEKLLDIERRNAHAELGGFEILNVHAYSGTDSYTAEKHKGCTIVPQSLGGSNYVDMPVAVYLSNDKELGTVTAASIKAGAPVFTADT